MHWTFHGGGGGGCATKWSRKKNWEPEHINELTVFEKFKHITFHFCVLIKISGLGSKGRRTTNINFRSVYKY